MSEVVCACCKEQRAELRGQKSRLIPSNRFMLCNSCKQAGHEPRYVIILVARAEGTDAVAEYIRGKKYHGAAILGSEILV